VTSPLKTTLPAATKFFSMHQRVYFILLSIFIIVNGISSSKLSLSNTMVTGSGSKSSANFFRQTLNLPSLFKALSLFKSPHLAVPDISLSSLSQISASQLRAKGVTCIVFDKDNTLTYTYHDVLHPAVSQTVTELRHEFGSDALSILSNSVGSSDDGPEFLGAKATEASLAMSVIIHANKKPQCLQEVLQHYEGKLKRQVQPREICVIGDRVLTDVMFANMNGMVSVLVAPLSYIKDHPIASFIRLLERHVLLPWLRLLRIKSTKN